MSRKESIYKSKSFRFINDNIRLTAVIYQPDGKQELILNYLNPKTGKTELTDRIQCIHTAIYELNSSNFQSITESDKEYLDLYRKSIDIRSTEKLDSIDLDIDEKFNAFISWVEGIAEAGFNAFKLQADIEYNSSLNIPISNRIMKFLSQVDYRLMLKYISKIEKDCKFEGNKHNSCLIANLSPILMSLSLETELDARDYNILRAIIDIVPPIKLFYDKYNAKALKYGFAAELPYFEDLISHELPFIREEIAINDNATIFDKYKKYLSYKTESDARIRLRAARNLYATRFPEYNNFFSEKTEPNIRVRMGAALNEHAVNLPGFINFLDANMEKNPSVRLFAAINEDARKLPEYKNFFSEITEPDIEVRSLVARIPANREFKEYQNFLSEKTESCKEIREIAKNSLNSNIS